jgi:hypothetical protein
MYASTIGLMPTVGVGIGTTVPSSILSVLESNVNGDVSRKNMFLGLRNGTVTVQNSVSMALSLGPNVNTISPYGALDIKLNGFPGPGNNYGVIPDITVKSIIGNGYVGIGTTAPSAPIHVYSSGGVSLATTGTVNYTNTSILGFGYGGGSTGTRDSFRIISQAVNRDSGAGPYYDYGVQADLVFQRKTNNLYASAANDITYTEAMRISGATGNVGIGTTYPLYALDIPSGKIRTSQLAMVGFTNIVNRRIFWGVGANSSNFSVSINTTTDTTVSLLGGLAYSPFQYAVPAVASGATRYFRLYVIYGDNMTTGSWNIDFVLSANSYTVTFSLPSTYGGAGILRDAYSNTIADPSANFYSHGYINIRANITGKGVNPVNIYINYIELQAIDQY